MDPIKLKILEDGTIKVETGNLAGPEHMRAEQFLQTLQRLSGGEMVREKLPSAHHHEHTHEHDHHHDHEHN